MMIFMAKHIIAGLTLFILLMTPNIAETSELIDYSPFLLAADGELPDDSAYSLTEFDEQPDFLFDEQPDFLFDEQPDFLVDEQPDFLFGESLASGPDSCTSNGDLDDNLFLSNGIARIRPRNDACLPLPPSTNIYDSNTILNQLSPPTVPKSPDPTIPGTEQDEDKLRLEQMFKPPSFVPDTNSNEEDDVCPKELVGGSQIPVCSLGSAIRDALRRPGEDYYTWYNVRHCRFRELCLFFFFFFCFFFGDEETFMN